MPLFLSGAYSLIFSCHNITSFPHGGLPRFDEPCSHDEPLVKIIISKSNIENVFMCVCDVIKEVFIFIPPCFDLLTERHILQIYKFIT